MVKPMRRPKSDDIEAIPPSAGVTPGCGPAVRRHRRRPRSFDFLIRPSYWCASRWPCTCATVSMVTLTTIRSDVPPK